MFSSLYSEEVMGFFKLLLAVLHQRIILTKTVRIMVVGSKLNLAYQCNAPIKMTNCDSDSVVLH